MALEPLAVVCAWCNRTMTAAPTGTAVTHTICPPCVEQTIANAGADLDGDSSLATSRTPPPDYFGDVFKD